MTRMEQLAKCDEGSLRQTFLETVRGDKAFQWMVAALESNLDESATNAIIAARKHANDFPVGYWHNGLYSPGLIQENLLAAQDLLARCFDRRERIQALESQAITLGLQYLLDSEQRDDQFVTAKLHVESAAAVAKLPVEPVLEALKHQQEVQQQVQLARTAQHGVTGSALNFGERIALLGRLYVDDLVRAAFRVEFAHVGLEELAPSGLGIKWEAPPNQSADYAYLGRLMAWTDDALHQYSRMKRGERERTFLLDFSEGDWILQDYLNRVRSGETKVEEPFKFRLSRDRSFEGSVRAIVGIGALLTCTDHDSTWKVDPVPANRTIPLEEKRYEARRRRNEISMSITLKPPVQGKAVTAKSWLVLPITIESAGFQDEGRSQDFVKYASFANVGRLSLDGEWEMQFPDMVTDASRRVPLVEFLQGLKTGDGNTVAFTMVGVRLYFRCLC